MLLTRKKYKQAEDTYKDVTRVNRLLPAVSCTLNKHQVRCAGGVGITCFCLQHVATRSQTRCLSGRNTINTFPCCTHGLTWLIHRILELEGETLEIVWTFSFLHKAQKKLKLQKFENIFLLCPWGQWMKLVNRNPPHKSGNTKCECATWVCVCVCVSVRIGAGHNW